LLFYGIILLENKKGRKFMELLKTTYRIDINDIEKIMQDSSYAFVTAKSGETLRQLFFEECGNDCYKMLYVGKDDIMEEEDTLEDIISSSWRPEEQKTELSKKQILRIAYLKAIREYLDKYSHYSVTELLVDVSW
jgi:hypothetical protein